MKVGGSLLLIPAVIITCFVLPKPVSASEGVSPAICGEYVEQVKNLPAVIAPTTSLAQYIKAEELRRITGLMQNAAKSQSGRFVNIDRIETVELDGKQVLSLLKAFQNNPSVGIKSSNHQILIKAKLQLAASKVSADPKDSKKTVIVHTFKNELSDSLVILGVLIERPSLNEPNKAKIDELHIRFAKQDKGKITQLDIPLINQYFSDYTEFDKKNKIVDHGLKYTFNAKLNYTDPKGKKAVAGVQCELKNSLQNSDATDVLGVNFYIVK